MAKRDTDRDPTKGAPEQRRDILKLLLRIFLSVLCVALGILFLTNSDLFSSFLFYCATYVFGVFFFLPGVLLIILGIYLFYRAFRIYGNRGKKQDEQRRIQSHKAWALDISCALGALFCIGVLVSATLPSSLVSTEGETLELTASQITSYYGEAMRRISPSGLNVSIPGRYSSLGGGFLPTLVVGIGVGIGMGTLGIIIMFAILTALLVLVLFRHPVKALVESYLYLRSQVRSARALAPQIKKGVGERFRKSAKEETTKEPQPSQEQAQSSPFNTGTINVNAEVHLARESRSPEQPVETESRAEAPRNTQSFTSSYQTFSSSNTSDYGSYGGFGSYGQEAGFGGFGFGSSFATPARPAEPSFAEPEPAKEPEVQAQSSISAQTETQTQQMNNLASETKSEESNSATEPEVETPKQEVQTSFWSQSVQKDVMQPEPAKPISQPSVSSDTQTFVQPQFTQKVEPVPELVKAEPVKPEPVVEPETKVEEKPTFGYSPQPTFAPAPAVEPAPAPQPAPVVQPTIQVTVKPAVQPQVQVQPASSFSTQTSSFTRPAVDPVSVSSFPSVKSSVSYEPEEKEPEEDVGLSDEEAARAQAEADRALDEALASSHSSAMYYPAPKVVHPDPVPLNQTAETPKAEAPVSTEDKGETVKKNTYVKPSVSLLLDYDNTKEEEQIREADDQAGSVIMNFLRDNNIQANYDGYDVGASVSRFHLCWKSSAKSTTISAGAIQTLAIKLNGNMSVRFVPIIPGCDYSAIEIGNPVSMKVPFREAYLEMMREDRSCSKPTLFPLGQDLGGKIVTVELEKQPHLLVAGSTGSGKSVFIHSLICSMIMRTNPDDLKFVLIDPKKVEFTKYADMPHLFCPIISEATLAVKALEMLVGEMERRYQAFQNVNVNNLEKYRAYTKGHKVERMPIIVVIIDEFADLMMADSDASTYVARLAAKARACGIHLVVATQRPSVQVITGDIKNNIPARIALSVSSGTDSRVILDEMGAETLMGHGDLLAKVPGQRSMIRAQSPFIVDQEIDGIVSFLKAQREPRYDPKFAHLDAQPAADDTDGIEGKRNILEEVIDDPLYQDAKELVVGSGNPHPKNLARLLGVSTETAQRYIDAMEAEGVVIRTSADRLMVNKPDED